ncbi:acetyl-CoA carboxylase biotin carboxyl carrier protein [Enterococcus casseliflavus]|uniref:acetyl-CoA carboxylase biotin carboxyl carrier protein n=1 Tax=Enterococcus casseliflavus TaxID=37734 RepID=UPI00288D379A|nr:acetyl-CoA carboxylase biotin carboxyl carrier protein [Enterococcus casseliflavus]MDT2989687.1 acetyl-CoA carboxylase biotin carboxyl carrier protein [Enterococcus casseliflavus]MDV7689682.1 acetyl-CoA carboxylase biotin carboxyl carrier protein [Enterococcus casseliflavus]
METHEVKELLSQFDQSTLTELQLKKETFELYFNKNTTSGLQSASSAPASAPAANAAPTPVAPTPAVSATSDTVETAKPVLEGKEVVSPLVGVVYLKPSPDKDNFKQIGDHVKKGDILCIVEAMKVMNEIVSDVDGELVEVLVESEQIVEYNQPLFRVKEG